MMPKTDIGIPSVATRNAKGGKSAPQVTQPMLKMPKREPDNP